MNEIESRLYSQPETRNIPVGYLSTMKDIMQKILEGIREENPYATVTEILAEDTDGEI